MSESVTEEIPISYALGCVDRDAEITSEEYDYMMQIASTNGLCPNCFHTFACCGGRCSSPNDMLHNCMGETR